MKKTRIALLALIACSGIVAAGCSSSQPTAEESAEVDVQRVNFDLTSLDGADVDELLYTLTNTTTSVVKTGTLDVSFDDSLDLSLLLRPGQYSISFSGTGTYLGANVPCAGSANFTVVAGSNPSVDVSIVCEAGSSNAITQPSVGQIDVNATLTVNHEVVEGECGFTHAFIGPLNQLVGHAIDTESEFVVIAGATGTVAWTASAGLTGSFGSASAANTTYTCSAAGTGTITATLSSGVENCNDTVVATVNCFGESGSTGSTDSTSTAETSSTAETTSTAETSSTAETTSTAETSSTSDTTSTAPVDDGSDCIQCFQNDPGAVEQGFYDFYASGCAADPLCEASRLCIDLSGCMANADNSANDCYCGDGISVEACISPSFVPFGPCVDQIKAGTPGASTNLDYMGLLANPTVSSGLAFQIMAFANDVNVCEAECL